MTMRAEHSRHIKTLWRNPDCMWSWWALKYGHAQPQRFALGDGPWRYRPIRFHFTPVHFERWNNYIEIGVCFGRRTLYLLRHK